MESSAAVALTPPLAMAHLVKVLLHYTGLPFGELFRSLDEMDSAAKRCTKRLKLPVYTAKTFPVSPLSLRTVWWLDNVGSTPLPLLLVCEDGPQCGVLGREDPRSGNEGIVLWKLLSHSSFKIQVGTSKQDRLLATQNSSTAG